MIRGSTASTTRSKSHVPSVSSVVIAWSSQQQQQRQVYLIHKAMGRTERRTLLSSSSMIHFLLVWTALLGSAVSARPSSMRALQDWRLFMDGYVLELTSKTPDRLPLTPSAEEAIYDVISQHVETYFEEQALSFDVKSLSLGSLDFSYDAAQVTITARSGGVVTFTPTVALSRTRSENATAAPVEPTLRLVNQWLKEALGVDLLIPVLASSVEGELSQFSTAEYVSLDGPGGAGDRGVVNGISSDNETIGGGGDSPVGLALGVGLGGAVVLAMVGLWTASRRRRRRHEPDTLAPPSNAGTRAAKVQRDPQQVYSLDGMVRKNSRRKSRREQDDDDDDDEERGGTSLYQGRLVFPPGYAASSSPARARDVDSSGDENSQGRSFLNTTASSAVSDNASTSTAVVDLLLQTTFPAANLEQVRQSLTDDNAATAAAATTNTATVGFAAARDTTDAPSVVSDWTVPSEPGDTMALPDEPFTPPRAVVTTHRAASVPPPQEVTTLDNNLVLAPTESFERERPVLVQKDMMTSAWSNSRGTQQLHHHHQRTTSVGESVLQPSHFRASAERREVLNTTAVTTASTSSSPSRVPLPPSPTKSEDDPPAAVVPIKDAGDSPPVTPLRVEGNSSSKASGSRRREVI
jgi:hypothetical protein